MRKQLSTQFEIIYCNHLWSVTNLYKLSYILKISYSLNKNIIIGVSIKKIFTEKLARIWRYSAIYRTSQFYNYEIILTAHTKTDQIETLLLNLFRSSGKKGLSVFFNNAFLVSKSIKEIFLSEKELNL